MSEYVQQQVQILKSDTAQRYTLGVIYEPNVVDTQGDWMEAGDVEAACWDFMIGLAAGECGVYVEHDDDSTTVGTVVECYIMPVAAEIGGQQIPQGSWMMAVIWDDATWQMIQDGSLTGYSMGGVVDKVYSNGPND